MEAGAKVSGLRELQHQISADRGQARMDLEHTKVRGSQSGRRTSKNMQNGNVKLFWSISIYDFMSFTKASKAMGFNFEH